MATTQNSMLKFLHKRRGFYENPHKVQAVLLGPDYINLSVKWPGRMINDDGMEIFMDVTVEALQSIVGVSTVKEFDTVTRKKMISLYKNGDAGLWVITSNDWAEWNASFWRKDDRLYVYDDNNKLIKRVGRELVTTKDYISYTQRHAIRRDLYTTGKR